MTWRISRDESKFSPARKLAWEFILPYQHLPILNSDYDKAQELTEFLEKFFSPQALKAALKRMEGGKMKPTQEEIERVIEEVWNPLDPKRIALALLEKFNIERKEE